LRAPCIGNPIDNDVAVIATIVSEHSHINESARAARAAHARMMRGNGERLFVYYRKHQIETFTEDDAISIDWKPAFLESVPSNLTADQLVTWFAARTGRIPYL
jgi:hypothetical protein